MGTSVIAERGAPAVTPVRRARWSLRRVLLTALGVLALVLVVAYVGVSGYVAERLTRPERASLTSLPTDYGLSYKDVEFKSTVDNIPLSGWLIDSPGDKAILMMHGRNMTRDRDEAFLEKAALFNSNNYDVFMFDFRGHGLSGGERYAFGQWEVRDVAGALAYLKAQGYTDFGVYGVSMGGGTALLAAPDHPEIKALVVDSPYAEILPIIDAKLSEQSHLPAFFNPGILLMARLMYGIDFSQVRPVDAVAGLGDRPIFHIQSTSGDKWIPFSQGDMLRSAGASNPNFTSWVAPGEGHVHAYTNNKEEYTRRMLEFYAKHLK